MQRRLADGNTLVSQGIAKLEKGAVPVLAEPVHNQIGMSFCLVGIAVAAKWTGSNISLPDTCLIGSLMSVASVASAAECGNVSIASMNWQSAEVLSNLDKIILNEGYGCQAEITVGDTVPTITSMSEKGQPDIAPEA